VLKFIEAALDGFNIGPKTRCDNVSVKRDRFNET